MSSPDSSDLLVFKASPGDDGNVRELKRVIALVDAPRPEITLNAGSGQVSAPKQETVDKMAKAVRDVVYDYNQKLQEALWNGWEHLAGIRGKKEKWAKYFTPYVLARYEYPRNRDAGCDPEYGAYWYCLGYEGAFSTATQPSLTNMIGILAGL